MNYHPIEYFDTNKDEYVQKGAYTEQFCDHGAHSYSLLITTEDHSITYFEEMP